MITSRVVNAAAVVAVPRNWKPRVIVAAVSAACQKRPLRSSAPVPITYNSCGSSDGLSPSVTIVHERSVGQGSRAFSRFLSAVATEFASGEAGAKKESVAAHTVVRHPPAPGWKYPPIPGGLEAKFAVFQLGNTQFKVTKDDLIVAEKIKGAEIGTTLEMKEVLLVGTPEDTVIGRPLVPGATVKLFVEQQTKDKKVIVFKKRRRKSSKTTHGHRREVTLLRVAEIIS